MKEFVQEVSVLQEVVGDALLFSDDDNPWPYYIR